MPAYVAGHIANAHLPSAQPKDKRPTEHRCPNCYTPGFGKSNIRCKNEPRPATRAEPTPTPRGENHE